MTRSTGIIRLPVEYNFKERLRVVRGNRVYYNIRYVNGDEGMMAMNAKMAEPSSTHPNFQNHTVLIVDDTPANLETLYSYFESLGFEIMMAQSGPSALKRVAYAQPDIILLDVVMPGMDGFETCRQLKANDATKNIPVIFMTALTDTVHKVKGLQAGAADYITKPFQIEEVLARIQTHLALRDLQAQLETQNERLQIEIRERQAAAAALQRANDELELRVERRTAELAQANANLAAEMLNPQGGNLPHNNRQPYLGLTFIIALQGVYPPRP